MSMSGTYRFLFFILILRFFTLGTSFGFRLLLDLFDALLKFLLKNFLEELFSGNEQKVIQVVDCLPLGGIVHDLIASTQQKIKAFHKQIANAG